jgi:hypothetical protein
MPEMLEKPTDQSEREEIRRFIAANLEKERRKQRYVFFFVNVFVVLLLTLIAWGIAIAAPVSGGSNPAIGSLIVLSIAGGLGILMHFFGSLYSSSEAGERQLRRNLAFQARINRFIYGSTDSYEDTDDAETIPSEKPKRESGDQYVRLSDDGELIPDDEQLSAKASRSGRVE